LRDLLFFPVAIVFVSAFGFELLYRFPSAPSTGGVCVLRPPGDQESWWAMKDCEAFPLYRVVISRPLIGLPPFNTPLGGFVFFFPAQ